MIKLNISMLRVIQFEQVFIVEPSKMAVSCKERQIVYWDNDSYEYEFAYTYNLQVLENFFVKNNIFGGLVFDPKRIGENETFFTLFLYHQVRESQLRRVNLLGFKCRCGREGISISAYDTYKTICLNKKYFREQIGKCIDKETTKACSMCGEALYPVQHTYRQIDNSAYLAATRL